MKKMAYRHTPSQYLEDVLGYMGDLNAKSVPCAQGKGNYRPAAVTPQQYQSINAAMQNTIREHRGDLGGVFRSYNIIQIERIGNQSLMDRYNNYKIVANHEHRGQGANERMLFHGSPNVNNIVHNGFDKSETNPSGMFGGGFYFTDISSKASQYVNGRGGCRSHRDTSCYVCERKLLLCRVVLGNSMQHRGAYKYDTAPIGYHSVTGVPSDDGLKHAEYVVYKSTQIYPELVITYRIKK